MSDEKSIMRRWASDNLVDIKQLHHEVTCLCNELAQFYETHFAQEKEEEEEELPRGWWSEREEFSDDIGKRLKAVFSRSKKALDSIHKLHTDSVLTAPTTFARAKEDLVRAHSHFECSKGLCEVCHQYTEHIWINTPGEHKVCVECNILMKSYVRSALPPDWPQGDNPNHKPKT